MTPRWMVPSEDAGVRALFARCHPGNTPRPPHWFQAHPTLVVYDDLRLVGFTSFVLAPCSKGYVAYGHDLCVAPERRQEGLGTLLHAARCRIARDLGAVDFVGLTAPDNTPMIAIFERQGLTPQQTIPNAYPDECRDGVVWIGSLP